MDSDLIPNVRRITTKIQRRRPRCIVVLGLPFAGKTTLLQSLTSVLNLPTASWTCTASAPSHAHVLTPLLDQLQIPPAQTLDQRMNLVTEPVVICIDDFDYLLDDNGQMTADMAQSLDLVLNHAHVTLLLASCRLPEWTQLTRMAIRGTAMLIDYDELALHHDDVAWLWEQHQHDAIDSGIAQQIVVQTQGWAVAVALACRQGLPFDDNVLHVLFDDTLDRLPSAMLDAISAVTWLELLSAELIAHVTDQSQSAHIWREWQRIGIVRNETLHPLIAQALRRRYPASLPNQQTAIVRAVDYWAEQGDFAAAVRLARQHEAWLALVAMLDRHYATLNNEAYYPAVVAWLHDVPQSALLASGNACFLLVRSFVGVNDSPQAILCGKQLASALLHREQRRRIDLLVANILQAMGDMAEADATIEPYRTDADLAPEEQARILRIQGIVLSLNGAIDAGFDCLSRAHRLLEALPPTSLTALTCLDYANLAAQMGRYTLAERLLGFAERIWRDMSEKPPVALATVLNMQATVALQTYRFDLAEKLAVEAYTLALARNKQRNACGAMTTHGDVAIARGDWELALVRYELAREYIFKQDTSLLPYNLAMSAHAARQHKRSSQEAILRLIEATHSGIPLEHAWLIVGRVSLYLGLGIRGGEQLIETALKQLGTQPSLAHGMLWLLLSEVCWQSGNLAAAQRAWHELDQLLLDGRGGLPVLLTALAQPLHGLLQIAYEAWQSPFAGRLYQAERAVAHPVLDVRVLGEMSVWWHGRVVRIPKHGYQLLTLLLLAGGGGLDVDDLRTRIWRDGGSDDGWRKLIERVRHVLPESINKVGNNYRLNVPFDLIRADVLQVKSTPLINSSSDDLRHVARLVVKPLLPGFDSDWIVGEQAALTERGSEIWFTLGNREQDDQRYDSALEAYRTALVLNPLNERAIIAAMSLALDTQQRHVALDLYERYRHDVGERLGIEPSSLVQALFKRALDETRD